MPNDLTEQELAGLSAAERAIMEADDGDDDQGAEDEGGEQGGAEEGKPEAEKKPEQAAEVKPEPKEEKPDAEDDDDAGVKFQAQTPADAAKTRTDLETRKDEAFTKLMDGEIDSAAYKLVEKEVNGELEKLLQATITDNVTATLTQAQATQQWNGEVKALLKSAAAEGLDYKADAALGKELDGLIRVFAAEASASGMSDAGLKASKWALAQAHSVMKVRHGKAAASAPSPAAKREAPDLSKIPPSLSKAPIAAGTTVADEFAHMAGLTGAASERAVAKLTPEQLERYLA